MKDRLRIAMAQLNLVVGDVPGNTDRVIGVAREARDDHVADLIMFPELTLTGYPPEDLLFHSGLRQQVERQMKRLVDEIEGIAVLVGYPDYKDDLIYNAAALIENGRIRANYHKQHLPNYGVFDEKRYFEPGSEPCVVELVGWPIGLTICEDIWRDGPVSKSVAAGAGLILNINASPYDMVIHERREGVIHSRVRKAAVPMAYVNYVGGQDELVYDGGSVVVDSTGEVTQRAPDFEEGIYIADFEHTMDQIRPIPGTINETDSPEESVYKALVLGTGDYVRKHGFPGVVIGLSGGIDSALTLAIAVDALGAKAVRALMMPSRYTSDISLEDAQSEAQTLGVRYDVIPIESVFEATLGVLADLFEGLPPDATEENIQARCRGMILMAVSNKTGSMVLTTGNKSEMAVGYATLYGDMAGGFAPIKDCSKTLVYRLARYRNSISPVIPERVLTREPSAELRHDQKDADELPPYNVLDPILEAFIEEDLSVEAIAERGFDREVVGRILEMVKRNEYKRRQAPPGVRISRRAFGRDWRYPITSGYRA